jgi:hypothetical protein
MHQMMWAKPIFTSYAFLVEKHNEDKTLHIRTSLPPGIQLLGYGETISGGHCLPTTNPLNAS